MHILEEIARRVRHHPILSGKDRLWSCVRPIYDILLSVVAKKGLSRCINGTDTILVSTKFRNIHTSYEPRVWQFLMSSLRESDTVIDVGAHIGLYTISIAKRLGDTGRVIAFEPDKKNYQNLKEHIRINHLEHKVQAINAACGLKSERLMFISDNFISHIAMASDTISEGESVEVIALDDAFASDRIDLLKIDVEGYEEFVLRGAVSLLNDSNRKPRMIFIEIHPYAWQELGTTSESLLSLLYRAAYKVFDINGNPLRGCTQREEIIATLDDSGLFGI